jgi:hypothetical protein
MAPLTAQVAWPLIGATALLAYASYRWVETPFRQGRADRFTRTKPFLKASVVTMGLATVAVLIKWNQGWQWRFNPAVIRYDEVRNAVIPHKECAGRVPDNSPSRCMVGVDNGKRMLVWGDSHALAWSPAMDALGKSRGWEVILALHPACPPLMGVINANAFGCLHFNQTVYSWIEHSQVDTVFLIASWISYSEPNGQYVIGDEHGTIDALRKRAPHIVLIGPTPGAPSDIPFLLAFAKRNGLPAPSGNSRTVFDERSQYFWRAARPLADRVVLIDPSEWFCNGNTCQYEHEEFGLLYRDGGHLSVAGSEFVRQRFPPSKRFENEGL